MERELPAIDISGVPELVRIAEEVQRTGEPRVLKLDDVEIATISPVPARKLARRKTGLVQQDDPLWDIVGVGHSEGPGDVSERKHDYLAETYRSQPS